MFYNLQIWHFIFNRTSNIFYVPHSMRNAYKKTRKRKRNPYSKQQRQFFNKIFWINRESHLFFVVSCMLNCVVSSIFNICLSCYVILRCTYLLGRVYSHHEGHGLDWWLLLPCTIHYRHLFSCHIFRITTLP